MKKLAETHHLQKRGAAWYYRRRVPKNLRIAFGECIQRSLGTTAKKTAIRKRELLDVEWSKRFEEAELATAPAAGRERPSALSRKVLTQAEAHQRVLAYVERYDAQLRRGYLTAGPLEPDEQEEWERDLAIELALAKGYSHPEEHDQYISSEWERIFPESLFEIDEKTFTRDEVFDLVKRAAIELRKRALAHARHDHQRVFFDRLFDPKAPPPVTVRELAEEYLTLTLEEGRAHKLAEKSIDKKGENLSLVRDILGDETLVRDINWTACRHFCSVLAHVPANRTKIYKGVPLNEALERAKEERRPGLAAITQGQYLTTLKDLLDLAVNKELIRTNYAKDLRPLAADDVAADEKTIPFDLDQLVAFFNSAYYRTCADGTSAPHRRADKSWRFWFPLVSLFSGMRPKEIFQMHVNDVRCTEKGTWFFDIVATSDDDDEQAPQLKKTTKTKTSRRQIPIHPELQRLGFLAFVEEQRKASDDPLLFRGIKRNQYKDPAHYPLRRFREVFLREAIELKPRQTAYSFRHTWRDAARRINASEDFLKAIGAWRGGKSTSDIYGSKDHPDLYAAHVAKIAFEGLDLSYLYVKPEAD